MLKHTHLLRIFREPRRRLVRVVLQCRAPADWVSMLLISTCSARNQRMQHMEHF